MDNTFLEHASNVLGDTNGGLSDIEINKYILEYAVSNNVSLPNNKEYPNKRTKLFEYLKKFDTKSCINIIYKLTLLDKFNNNDAVTKLREQLISKYGQYIDNKVTDTVIVQQTKHWLENYPNAFEPYCRALKQYESKNYTRNILDNMRLSLESLLKDILNNSKSLENQKEDIGAKLKKNNLDPHIRNMFTAIIDMYCKYNNKNIKHGNKVHILETDYMIEQTSIMMKFLISVLGTNREVVVTDKITL